MVVVLSEDSFVDPNTVNGRELHAIVETVRMLGCRVFPIPVDFEECGTAENALAYLPVFDAPVVGIWAGYIPSVERYTAIFEAAAAKGVQLINTPTQHQTAMEFDKFYPLLGELTPESVIVTKLEDLPAADRLQFPMFVRGTVKSNKDQGWNACVAQDRSELEAIAAKLLARDQRSRARSSRGSWSNFARLPPTASRFRSAASIARSFTGMPCWLSASIGMNTAIPVRSAQRKSKR